MKLNKNQKIGLGVASGLAVIGTIIGVKKYKKIKTQIALNNDFFEPAGSGSGSGSKEVSFPLKYGDRNEMVRRFQKWVNSKAGELRMRTGVTIPTLKEDSIFGPKTLSAAKVALKSDVVTKSNFDTYKM